MVLEQAWIILGGRAWDTCLLEMAHVVHMQVEIVDWMPDVVIDGLPLQW